MPYKHKQIDANLQAHLRTMRREAVAGYTSLVQELMADLPALVITITHEKQSYHWEQSGKVRRHWLNGLNKRLYGSNYNRRGEGLISFFFF